MKKIALLVLDGPDFKPVMKLAEERRRDPMRLLAYTFAFIGFFCLLLVALDQTLRHFGL